MHCLMALTSKDQMLAVCTTQDERSLPASFALFLGLCGKVLMGVFFGNLMFLGIILFGTRKFLNAKIGDSRCKHILLSILVSSYFKIFVIAMMVWEFPSSVVSIIKMFVLSSNALALLGLGISEWLGVNFSRPELVCPHFDMSVCQNHQIIAGYPERSSFLLSSTFPIRPLSNIGKLYSGDRGDAYVQTWRDGH
uniref:Protein ARV n=1 Tax=Solanum lycopersicum TaxID=4081 RepID=A0A3Q7IQT8_SOLLC